MAKKSLIFQGGWQGHEPAQIADVITSLLEPEGFQVDIVDNLEYLEDVERLKTYDLITPMWTMGEIPGAAMQALGVAVNSGVGIGGQHGGMCDAFRGNIGYQWMTGGQFVSHPGGMIDYHVDIVSDDPIVAGIDGFDVHSEQYYMLIDPAIQVLASTKILGVDDAPWTKGTEMPVVWKKNHGHGRVFYSALGHVAAEFERHPQMGEILKRGLMWAAR